MIFSSILIALILERITPQLIDLKQNNGLREYSRWMVNVLQVDRFGAWAVLVTLVIPLMVITWVFGSIVNNAVFGIFELAFNIAIIFFCMGPKDLDAQVDNYLDAIETGDSQQRLAAAGQMTSENPVAELPAQAIQVCKSIYVEANSRIFVVVFWFVIFGPVAAVAYRLLDQLLKNDYLESSLGSVKSLIRQVIGWIDWVPTRLTLFVYMVSGHFEGGLQKYRDGSIIAVDMPSQNSELLQNVGFNCITSSEITNDSQAMDLVKKSRGLILRSLVVWLVLLFVISALI